jgi:hypothetical protein
MIFDKILNALKFDEIIAEVMAQPSIKSKIIELNQQQLNDLGVDSEGKALETYLATGSYPYAFSTVQIKKDKGQPYDRVTLKDTGAFQKSFSVKSDDTFSTISGNTKKGSEDISRNVDISKVFGLTETSNSELIQYLKTPMLAVIRKRLK